MQPAPMKQPKVKPYKKTTIMKPTDKTKPTLLLAAALVCLLAAGCEKPKPGPSPEPTPDPITVLDTLPPDTVWVSPPYDTAAALEGRVWRSEETWPEWHREGNTIQMQLHGYAVTTTLLEGNRFRADVEKSSGQRWFAYFEVGSSEHRYLYCPEWSEFDSTLYLLPADAPMEADTNPSLCPYMSGFKVREASDTTLYIATGGPGSNECIRSYKFKRVLS